MKHSREPWRIDPAGWIVDADSETVVLNIRDADYGVGWDKKAKEDDIRRIVTCVNACGGISTERLERNAPGDLISFTRDVLRVLIMAIEKHGLMRDEEFCYHSAIACLGYLEGQPTGSLSHMASDFRCNSQSGNWLPKRMGWTPPEVAARVRGIAAELRQLGLKKDVR